MRKALKLLALLVVVAFLTGAIGLPFPAANAQKDKDKDKGKATATVVFEMYKDRTGDFRFRIKDADGTLLAASVKGFLTKADCQKAIDTIKKEAGKAKIVEQAK